MMYNNELYHYGIKRRSGRYPYGSGDRPYQGEEGSRKRGLFSFGKRKEEKKKSTLPDPSTPEYEKMKRRAIKEGSATEVLRFKGDLSQKELQAAYDRINMERKLRDISIKEMDDAWNSVDRVMKKVGNAKDWGQTFIDVYNMLDKQRNRQQNSSSKK